jgi:hypothetical protein
MSPTQKRRISSVKRAGATGLLTSPDRTMMALEGKGYLRSEPDAERLLSVRYFVTEKCK